MNHSKKRVVVGMSGGVDSSVVAYLLAQQDFEVIGMFMKNWEEQDANGNCLSSHDQQDVARVCDTIGIPYYTVNFVEEYRRLVFTSFIEELRLGYTPNPDILCNREIKFKVFLQKALELGADFLATGHYARNATNQLLRAVDPNKDQSYFLYTLTQNSLAKVLFPIGHLHKSEVRRIAKEAALPTFAKKDSTGLCFIGERNFSRFLSGYIPYQPGIIQTYDGKKIGHHRGVAHYTIGQRKGLAIGGAGQPWFVVNKDVTNNTLIVAQGENHPALYTSSLRATDVHWIAKPPSSLPYRCTCKIRYRQQDQECIITTISSTTVEVCFPKPQRAVTPRQSIVFYDGDLCLGGAMIAPTSTENSCQLTK